MAPSKERFRRDQGLQFLKHPAAQFLGLDGQTPALITIQAQPLVSELLAQHAVLFLEVIDHVALMLVQPAASEISSRRKGSSVRLMVIARHPSVDSDMR
jgi:hypothetical protein